MTARLFVGRYEMKDIDATLASFGYNSAIIFDGYECGMVKNPFMLSESDNVIYHLAGFLTVLDKKISKGGDDRPIVLYNVTERLDESTSLEKYIAKIRKYGRDVFIFSESNEVQRGLILSVRLTDFSKYNADTEGN